MNIGDKIRNARIQKNLTQEELGNMLGVQKSAIAKWENGRVVNIKRSNLKKLSDILEIPAHELISDDWENPTEDMAEFHASILMDQDLMQSIREYYSLDNKTQKIVRNFIHSLVKE
ncbi:helix-turn-helix domain-containing protein [Treponema sp.]|uniref:helix-turn-helix domain-containing protein n=1 Tax=Treponema sp. TaxID=166 RepID=UPI003890F1A9